MTTMQEPPQPICIGCGKKPSEIDEYVELAETEGIMPDDFVRWEEGTYNHDNGHFACTECYLFKLGGPVAPGGWKAP